MWTLHSVTQETRTILKWAAIGIGTIIVILFLIRTGKQLKEYFFPTPQAAPTVGFGKLPKMDLPTNVVSGDFTYTLDTISGFLPAFPDRERVYPMLSTTTSLLDLDRAREKVSHMGFDLKTQGKVIEKSLSPTVYTWTETDGAVRSVTMNTVTNTFSLVSPFLTDPLLASTTVTFTPDDAKQHAQDFFGDSGLFPSSIDTTLTTTSLFSVTNNTLIPATKIDTAQLMRVDFFQKNQDELPFVYTYPPRTNITAIVDGGSFQGKVMQANYFYQQMGDKSETYPIINSAQAFDELKQGRAYIASYTGTSSSIKIKTISLAYFLPNKETKYVYPVFVFKGTDNFIAYLPAITAVWFE
jgi:hypothetical protein